MGLFNVKMKGSFLYLGQRKNPLVTIKDDKVTSVDLSELVIIDTSAIKHFKLFIRIVKFFIKSDK